MAKKIKKLKKRNKLEVTVFFAVSIIYILGYILFLKNILSLTGIETGFRIIALLVFALYLVFYFFRGASNITGKQHKLFILKTVVAILFIIFFALSSSVIEYAYSKLQNLEESSKIEYTAYLIKLKDKDFNNDSLIGIINKDTDEIVNTLGNKIIKENKLTNKTKEYDDYLLMLQDLYDNKINAIFVQDNYVTLFDSEEKFTNVAEETEIIYKTSKLMANKDASLVSLKNFTDPISVLIMGVDSTTDGLNANAAFNGDTLMLVTFNPHNLNATMFSIPRDTYVPIACKNNAKAKINSSAAYGTQCVIDTVEKLTDINIDYYVKINFKGVVDLVEALGGIDVDVQAPDVKTYGNKVCEQNSDRQFGNKLVCMEPGMQTLNGEQALAYSRCRHLYLISDLARIKHQQDVVTAMGQKVAKIRNFNDFKKVIDAVTKNISTNMNTSQMLSAYQVLKNMAQNSLEGEEFITINKSYLEVYNLRVFLASSNMYTSALGYYPSSLNAIIDAMKINLELKKPELIKEFNFSANTTYEIKAVGEGIRTGSTDTTLLNFTNSTIGYTQAWCNKNSIKCTFENVDENSNYYNSLYADGMVVAQSVHDGALLSSFNSITFYVNKKSTPKTESSVNNKIETTENNKTTNNQKDNDENNNNKNSNEKSNSIESVVPGMPEKKEN